MAVEVHYVVGLSALCGVRKLVLESLEGGWSERHGLESHVITITSDAHDAPGNRTERHIPTESWPADHEQDAHVTIFALHSRFAAWCRWSIQKKPSPCDGAPYTNALASSPIGVSLRGSRSNSHGKLPANTGSG